MKNSISVHDNIILSYAVLCDKAEIHIRTKSERNEHIEIVFYGVEAYHFEGDNFNSIILDIGECTNEEILSIYSKEFEKGIQYCWPGHWNESKSKGLEYLNNKNTKAWQISSSYGMGGFVIGKTIEYKRNN